MADNDELEVIGKGLTLLAADAVLLLAFVGGSTGLEAIAEGDSSRGMMLFSGFALVTTILYGSLAADVRRRPAQ